ncbi:MAG: GNAT family N-acetyltransferase [Acidobacteriota bacterium]
MSSAVQAPVTMRSMRDEDIDAGLSLCRASKWNQTRRDWELFLRLSPKGCRVAVKDDSVIGTVTTVRYADHFAWIGMVLVDPAERGQGIAALLMSEAMDSLDDMPSLRLDATPAGHGVYRKLNFADEYPLARMERTNSRPLMSRESSARPMTKDDLKEVACLDKEVFGADRTLTLEWMFDGAPEYGWIVEREGRIAGYLLGRHGFNREHLGPVVGAEESVARQLVHACLERHQDRQFILDASQQVSDWRGWLESLGFEEQRPFIRMYYRDNPYPGQPQKQFGILGPEFG